MTVRLLIVIILMPLVIAAARGDTDDPIRFGMASSWSGRILLTPQDLLLHRSKPAWTSTEPALQRISTSSTVLRSALPGMDIRDAAIWRGAIIALRVQSSGADVLVLDMELTIRSQREVPLDRPLQPTDRVVLACDDRLSNAYVLLGTDVFVFDPSGRGASPRLIERRVQGVAVAPMAHGEIAIVHDVGGTAFLTVRDARQQTRAATTVPGAPMSTVIALERTIAVVSEVDGSTETQITFVDPETNETRTLTVATTASLIDIAPGAEDPLIAAVSLQQGHYVLSVGSPAAFTEGIPSGTVLDRDLGLPVALRILGRRIYVIDRAGLVTADLQGAIQSRDPMELNIDARSAQVLERSGVTYVTSLTGSARLIEHRQPLWWAMRAMKTIGAFLVPIVLCAVILVLWLRQRRLRRFIDTMLEVPGAGLLFMLDASGRLIRTNELAARLLRISGKVPMGRSFHAYVQHRGVEGVRAVLTQAYTDQRPLSEKVHVDDGDEQREYVFTSVPMFGTFGRLRGIVITGVDITEALERRRLVNWAQLAHDMQTNLSTIRLNAEQLAREAAEGGNERVRRILFQTRVLTQRVRDLVSVGRSEELVRAPVHSAEFCTQIRHEFDPEMFPHVTFSMKLRGTMMNVDRLKLSRAVRNAVENAIKALRGQPGTVEIATWSDREHVYIRVSDTGVGMDTLTLEHMMKPYFTTAKDGSGTGIGTMIMQHVTHLHGGSLRVTSEPGHGTQVVFRIPHMMQGARHTSDEAMETVTA